MTKPLTSMPVIRQMDHWFANRECLLCGSRAQIENRFKVFSAGSCRRSAVDGRFSASQNFHFFAGGNGASNRFSLGTRKKGLHSQVCQVLQQKKLTNDRLWAMTATMRINQKKIESGAGNTAETVRRRIEASGERVWRMADFEGMPFMAVAQALSRLTRQGVIRRLARAFTTGLGQQRSGQPEWLPVSVPLPAELAVNAAKRAMAGVSGSALAPQVHRASPEVELKCPQCRNEFTLPQCHLEMNEVVTCPSADSETSKPAPEMVTLT